MEVLKLHECLSTWAPMLTLWSIKERAPYFAVKNGNTEMARLLIEKGAKINNVSEGGETAKRIAVKQGNLEMIELLFSTDNFNINRNLWYASGDI